MIGLEFATGKIKLYSLQITKDHTGGKPTEKLLYLGWSYYGEKTVSYTRLYEARGADSRCDKVVRVPSDFAAETGFYVILEDGEQYRIDNVSTVIVATNVRALELTLIRIDARYDLAMAPLPDPINPGGGSSI